MKAFVDAVIYFGLVNTFFAFVIALQYRSFIAQRNAFEAQPGNHWIRWRIPKNRKDLTFWQMFCFAFVFLGCCLFVLFAFLIIINSVRPGQ